LFREYYSKIKSPFFYIMSRFVLNQTHPLIPREQNYVLDRKIITIHSNDRDISKWPKANHFEIELPEDITNVQSIRLVEITLPNSHYVFTNAYQNTKLSFDISGIYGGGGFGAINGPYIIEISEGSYTADQLAIEIATKMNQVVSQDRKKFFQDFKCKYNPVTNTFWFGIGHANTRQKWGPEWHFHLTFDRKLPYDIPCDQPVVWDHYSKWGLPAYLGYCKQTYVATIRDASGEFLDPSGGMMFEFEESPWLTPYDSCGNVIVVDISGGTDASGGNCCQMDIFGEQAIYMEIEKYNSMDELVPWPGNTAGMFNNDYSGKVNSAFAKIPIGLSNAFSLYGDSKNFYLMNATTFSPPIDRIKRLRFTFRFHDGRRVEFKCVPFNFSLEINMLRDEQPRRMNVRIPASFV